MRLLRCRPNLIESSIDFSRFDIVAFTKTRSWTFASST